MVAAGFATHVLPWPFSPNAAIKPFQGVAVYTAVINVYQPEVWLAGTSYGRFQLSTTANASVGCQLALDNASVYAGARASFLYIYKTKRTAEWEDRVWLRLSLHRNGTNASVLVTISGELDQQFESSGFTIATQTPLPEATLLDHAQNSILPVRALPLSGNLTAGGFRNYTANATEDVWINLTASASIKLTIEEETTTVVMGDWRHVDVFSWVRTSVSVHTEFEIELSHESSDQTATASFSLTLEGPGLET